MSVGWLVLRHEVASLLRMRETYTFGLLPAGLLVPVGIAGAVMVSSFSSDWHVGVPEHEPEGLAVVEWLEAADLEVSRLADPRAAFERGEVDVAIVVLDRLDIDGGEHLKVHVHTNEHDATDPIEAALESGLQEEYTKRFEAAGGGGPAELRVARVTVPRRIPDEVDVRQISWLFYGFFAIYVGCFVIPVRTAQERLQGVLEAFAVTATPMWSLYGARVVVASLLQLVVIGLIPLSLLLGLGDLIIGAVRPLDLVELVVAVMFVNALYVLCGLAANSARVAMHLGSYLILLAMPVAVAAVLLDYPWVPMLGFVRGDAVAPQLVRVASSVVGTGLLVALASRIAKGPRAVPPALADE